MAQTPLETKAAPNKLIMEDLAVRLHVFCVENNVSYDWVLPLLEGTAHRYQVLCFLCLTDEPLSSSLNISSRSKLRKEVLEFLKQNKLIGSHERLLEAEFRSGLNKFRTILTFEEFLRNYSISQVLKESFAEAQSLLGDLARSGKYSFLYIPLLENIREKIIETGREYNKTAFNSSKALELAVTGLFENESFQDESFIKNQLFIIDWLVENKVGLDRRDSGDDYIFDYLADIYARNFSTQGTITELSLFKHTFDIFEKHIGLENLKVATVEGRAKLLEILKIRAQQVALALDPDHIVIPPLRKIIQDYLPTVIPETKHESNTGYELGSFIPLLLDFIGFHAHVHGDDDHAHLHAHELHVEPEVTPSNEIEIPGSIHNVFDSSHQSLPDSPSNSNSRFFSNPVSQESKTPAAESKSVVIKNADYFQQRISTIFPNYQWQGHPKALGASVRFNTLEEREAARNLIGEFLQSRNSEIVLKAGWLRISENQRIPTITLSGLTEAEFEKLEAPVVAESQSTTTMKYVSRVKEVD